MSDTKPLGSCSVSKDGVVAMTQEDTSIEHIIKMEEVDLKPDYVECNFDGYIEMTDMDKQTDHGNELADRQEIITQNNNEAEWTTHKACMDDTRSLNVMNKKDVPSLKKVLLSKDLRMLQNSPYCCKDKSEINQDEEIKQLKKYIEVKEEINADDGIIPSSEHAVPYYVKTEIKIEQTERGDTDNNVEENKYLTEASNNKNNRIKEGEVVLKCKETKNKLNQKAITDKCNDSYKSVQNSTFYTCTYCDCTYTYKSQFTSHLRTHTGERPYSCTYCDYRFPQKSHLIEHLRCHTGEKPYSCNFCRYKCAQNSSLTKHLRIHTGEKPYSCTYCDYKCVGKSSLTLHLKRHNGEKPFSCKLCEYKSVTSSDLKVHIRVHTGEKPFSCTYCEYRCVRKSCLTLHLRSHTGEKPFKCNFCSYKSVNKNSLKKHLIRHTGEKPCDVEVVEGVLNTDTI